MDFLQPIKPILVLLVFVLYLVFYRRVRSKASHRLFATGVMGIAVLMILIPELATRVANVFGVGRGVDLVFYFLFLLFVYALLQFYGKVSELEQSITQMARLQAIRDARRPIQDEKDDTIHCT